MRDFGPDLFAGTAEYYAKYRAPYPPDFFNDVSAYFGLDGRGRMLDLGCGTGELAIPLAKYFEKVLALDPEPGMLGQARAKAKAAKTGNIAWRIGSSRDLTGVKGPFKLIGLGQSFHWMDTKAVINQLYDLAERGGGICIVGGGSQDPPVQSRFTAAKDQVIKDLIDKYLGPRRRAGNTFYAPGDESWENDVFPNSKFGGFVKRSYMTKVIRNADEELGNLYSMSWARRAYFGARLGQFEREFRSALGGISQSGKFQNSVKFEAYFLKK